MHINALLEKAKFAKEKIIAYHGTDVRNLRSILKHGLVKNHGEDGLGRGKTSSLGYTYDPHDGVYATTRLAKAINFSRDVAKGDTYSLVVVLQVQKKSIHLDEDEIFSILELREVVILDRIDELRDNVEDDEQLNSEADELIRELHLQAMGAMKKRLQRYNVDSNTIQHISKNANEIVLSMITKLIDGRLEHVEVDIREEQERLLKMFKHATRNDMDTLNVFQIPDNVNYRGANKIIGFIKPDTKRAWGAEIPDGFTKVRHPSELLPPELRK